MDIQTQLERTVIYLSSVAEGLESVAKGKTRFTYREIYNQFSDGVKYLNKYFANDHEITILIQELPHLVKPNLLNIELHGFWVIGAIGAFAPYFFLIFVAALFPIAFPVLLVRFFIISRTKSRAGKAKIIIDDIIKQLIKNQFTQQL